MQQIKDRGCEIVDTPVCVVTISKRYDRWSWALPQALLPK